MVLLLLSAFHKICTHCSKRIDPPDKFTIRVELWDRHIFSQDKILGMAEIVGIPTELKDKWHQAAVKVGEYGTINVRLYYRQAVCPSYIWAHGLIEVPRVKSLRRKTTYSS